MPKVKFVVRNQVSFGQAVYIITELKRWEVSLAQKLNCKAKKKWEISLDIDANELQYKYIVGDYDQLENKPYKWENRENRKVKFRKYQSSVTLVDKLNTKSIDLALFGNKCFDLVLVFGNCKDLILPRELKLQKIEGNNFLYYVRLYIDLNELNSNIEFFYQILFDDQDYISNKFQIDCSPQQQSSEVIRLSLTNINSIKCDQR